MASLKVKDLERDRCSCWHRGNAEKTTTVVSEVEDHVCECFHFDFWNVEIVLDRSDDRLAIDCSDHYQLLLDFFLCILNMDCCFLDVHADLPDERLKE